MAKKIVKRLGHCSRRKRLTTKTGGAYGSKMRKLTRFRIACLEGARVEGEVRFRGQGLGTQKLGGTVLQGHTLSSLGGSGREV